MYRKDLISREIEKLTKLLARLVGLKAEGRHEEATAEYETGLTEEFGFSASQLHLLSINEFAIWLQSQNFSAEKLDLFAKLIYHHAFPFKDDPETVAMLQKVLIIIDVTEKRFHVQSFENLAIISRIQQYLKEHDA